MDFADTEVRDAFFSIYEGLPRGGPGNRECTARALSLAGPLPEAPTILDIGCGPGPQTLDLAALIGDASIYAVDFHRPFLNNLTQRLVSAKLLHRVHAMHADMARLPFRAATIDLLWSEGAAYSIGFANALHRWRPLLADGGCIAVSEATWFGDHRPAEIVEFWRDEYPDMLDADGCLNLFGPAGYEVVDSFPVPEHAWWGDFYTPMLLRLEKLEERCAPDSKAAAVFASARREIQVFRRYSEVSGYTFIVARAV